MIYETIIDGKVFSIIAIGYFILSFLLSSDRSDLNLYKKIAVVDERPGTCHTLAAIPMHHWSGISATSPLASFTHPVHHPP